MRSVYVEGVGFTICRTCGECKPKAKVSHYDAGIPIMVLRCTSTDPVRR